MNIGTPALGNLCTPIVVFELYEPALDEQTDERTDGRARFVMRFITTAAQYCSVCAVVIIGRIMSRACPSVRFVRARSLSLELISSIIIRHKNSEL